jgi:hypothetical protein
MRTQSAIFSMACSALFILSASASAAIFPYGDFTSTSVKFVGVTESSGTDNRPLYGQPVVSADSLVFNPVSFNSLAVGAGGSDITDGTLTYDLCGLDGAWIDDIRFTERGDVTLAGFGTNRTFATANASFFLDIIEVDNVSIDPISVSGNLNFTTPSGGDFDLATDGGGGPVFQQIWAGNVNFDLDSILVDNKIIFQRGVTKVRISVDNTLTTGSEAGTRAFIAKKSFINVNTTAVPEASTLMLLSMAGIGSVTFGLIKRSGRRAG